MSVPEPRISQVSHQQSASQKNPMEGRWRWWYSAISDWMIEHPSGDMSDCAAHLSKHVTTIRFISATDMFRDFHAQRLQVWREAHDFALAHKLTAVAEQGLDLILDRMHTKRDQIPLNTLVALTSSSLEKLGYGTPQGPQVAVNVHQTDNRSVTIMAPVTPAALEEARDALRRSEERRAIEAREAQPTLLTLVPEPRESEAEPAESGGSCAPPTLDA